MGMKLALIMGTRPEIIKMMPIIKELEKRKIDHKVYFTSQHFTGIAGTKLFNDFKINNIIEYGKKFDFGKIKEWATNELKEYNPDVVLVQGDTDSALIGGLAAIKAKIPIGHIEAGLRSFNFQEPYPEEYNRTMLDSISTYLFCPTMNNLVNVQITGNRKAFIVGNTIIDVIKDYKKVKNGKQVLITLHRRENWAKIPKLCKALASLADAFSEYEFVFVKHVNKKLAKIIDIELKESKIKLLPPQSYADFIKLMQKSKLIISDSGGVLEEASYLNIPVISVRNVTERKESIILKKAILVGTEPESLKQYVSDFLLNNDYYKDIKLTPCPFGDGDSAKRIVDILEKVVK